MEVQRKSHIVKSWLDVYNKQAILEKEASRILDFSNHRRVRPGKFYKKGVPKNFAKFVRTLFFREHLQWLLLKSILEI